MKTAWRRIIDALVIIMAILTFGPFIFWFMPSEDTVTPDKTKTLDAEIAELIYGMPVGFYDMYRSPQSDAGSYEWQSLKDRKPLTPAFNYLQNVESVVYITAEDVLGYSYGAGSILTSDGVILTNAHNVSEADRVVATTYDGRHFPVIEVLVVDEEKDVAFLKIDAKELRPVPMGDDSRVAIGEQIIVIGHPEGFLNTISLGVLSGRRSYESIGEGVMLQITNAISAGNSGGMILNEYGEIIGMPTASVEYEDNSVQVQNINLAVPISEALEVLE